jgi:DNA (cytosine-5)-methyltransferase 1
MKKPRLLDLFCGAGGAGMGYHLAGFDVIGVDIAPQSRYPFEFHQADALEYLAEHGGEFDAIHASPPCQAYSIITPDRTKHPDLIPATRDLLEMIARPYVIENVAGARRALKNPLMLCGAQFGLKVYRHRLFEANVLLLGIPHYPHQDNTPRAGHGVSDKGFISVTSGEKSLKVSSDAKRRSGVFGMSGKGFVCVTGHFSGIEYCRMAMGIDWMTSRELSQAIPPAYTEWIGRQLIYAVDARPITMKIS